MNNSKSIIFAFIVLLPFCCFAQDAAEYVRVKFENTASYSFTVLTPSTINFDPRGSRWVEVKIGQDIMFKKMLKKKPLLTITEEMQNTVIDVSSTAKLRNKGNTEEIVYLRPPVEKMMEPDVDDDFVVEYADMMPSYKLGPDKLARYLNENLIYPDEANEEDITGIVVIDMIVQTDGSISNATLACDIGGGCGEEALRLVNEMPKWNAGLIDDRPVAVNIKLPIKFGPVNSNVPLKIMRNSGSVDSDYWTMRTHSQIRDFADTHKKVAILPATAKVTEHKILKKKRSSPEELVKKENELSQNIQLAFYERMLWLNKKEKLKVVVQDIEKTNSILKENDVFNRGNVSSLSPKEVAEILGVDAVFYGDIHFVQTMNKGAIALLSAVSNDISAPDAETTDLGFELYDGCSGLSIWTYHQNVRNSSLVWKTEKLIESMFKREMDKKFPYHVKYSPRS